MGEIWLSSMKGYKLTWFHLDCTVASWNTVLGIERSVVKAAVCLALTPYSVMVSYKMIFQIIVYITG